MDIPQERYNELTDAMALVMSDPYGCGTAFEGLLAYLEETAPKVALAIKFDIPDSVPEEVIRYGLRHTNTVSFRQGHPKMWAIDYPTHVTDRPTENLTE